MKCLVTGAAGFIGSNLVERLLRDGHQVVAVDNFSNGDRRNLSSMMDKIDFIWGDLRNHTTCYKICTGVDCVFHHAAIGSVPRSVTDPINSNDNNVGATVNLLTAAKDSKVKMFIFASSSSVYGNNDAPTKTENLPFDPLTPYGVSKMSAETYVRVFSRIYGMASVCFRYFNVFGPKQKVGGPYAAVIPNFITSAIRRQPIVIHGTGKQTRDFTYIDDVTIANQIVSGYRNIGMGSNVFNIGGGIQISIMDLAVLIKKLVDSTSEIVFDVARVGDIMSSRSGIAKAQKAFHYAPYENKNFEECLAETVKWYNENQR